MEPVGQIELAPKNGEFVILQDLVSGSWEVGRWAKESNSWVEINGKPLRLFPTHWVPISGDAAGLKKRDILFLLGSSQPKMIGSSQPKMIASKWLRPFILASMGVMLLIAGYAASVFGVLETGPIKVLNLNKIAGSAMPADRNLAATREEISLLVARENAAKAETLEAKRTADALATELSDTTSRVNQARAENLQIKQLSDANEKNLKKALDEAMARATTLERELLSVRQNIAATGKVLSGSDMAQDGVSQTRAQKRAAKESSAAPVTTGTVSNPKSPDVGTTGTPPFLASRGVPAPQPPIQLGRSPSENPIPSEDEARLLARAQFLIGQSDIAGARLLLEYAMEKGSPEAMFMLAETYENQTLQPLSENGSNQDAEKALKLYELAAAVGLEKARERLAVLKSNVSR
jgi:TPR repeat protein